MRNPWILGVLVIGAFLLGALTVWQLSPESKAHEFTIGQTTFVLRGWNDREEGELKRLYEEAYPQLQEIYGAVPITLRREEKVDVLVKKESTLEDPTTGVNPCGVENYQNYTSLYVIAVDSVEHSTKIHELAHAFFGPRQIRPDFYGDGFTDAAVSLVGKAIEMNLQESSSRCSLSRWWVRTLPAEKIQLVFHHDPARLKALEGARKILAARLWVEVLEQDPKFLAKVREQLLTEVLDKGTTSFNFDALVAQSFAGDWDQVKRSHPMLGAPPSGDQIVIVPVDYEDVEQLTAVAFVAGEKEKAIVGEEIDVEVWLEGELHRSFTDTTNDQGFIQLATVDELLDYGGCTLRFRVETDFGSDEVTFIPDPEKTCITGDRFGGSGLYHFYEQIPLILDFFAILCYYM